MCPESASSGPLLKTVCPFALSTQESERLICKVVSVETLSAGQHIPWCICTHIKSASKHKQMYTTVCRNGKNPRTSQHVQATKSNVCALLQRLCAHQKAERGKSASPTPRCAAVAARPAFTRGRDACKGRCGGRRLPRTRRQGGTRSVPPQHRRRGGTDRARRRSAPPNRRWRRGLQQGGEGGQGGGLHGSTA